MTRKFQFILHIGTEKTGTKTLQHLFAFNRQRLQDQGIFYLTTPERIEARGIAAAAVGDKQPDDYLKSIGIEAPEERRAFREATVGNVNESLNSLPEHVHTVIISSEHFHSRLRDPSQLEWLKHLLSDYAATFQVICYLRRQSDLVESYYSTMVKSGEKRTLEEIVERTCRSSNHYYNFHTLLERWSSCFGEENVTPRLFEIDFLEQGDIVKDFLTVTGIDVPLAYPGKHEKRYNESLTPLGQGLLRGVNKLASQAVKEDDVAHTCKELAARIIAEFPGRGEQLSKNEVELVESEFKKINAQVREQWFPEKKRLFPPRKKIKMGAVKQHAPVTKSQLKIIEQAITLLDQNGVASAHSLDDCVYILRSLAFYYEKSDLDLAWKLMRLARRIRPKGPLLNQKLNEYETLRSQPRYRLRRWIGW